MDILADENIDAPLVKWLRREGHDVFYVCTDAPGSSDIDILHTAFDQKRILLTQDLDFGLLIHKKQSPSVGIILLRIQSETSQELLEIFRKAWPEIKNNVEGHFITVKRRFIRCKPL